MTFRSLQLLAFSLVLGGAQLAAQDGSLWSTIYNNTGKTLPFTITDGTATVGSIYLGDEDHWIELQKSILSKSKLNGSLPPGPTKVYFNTNKAFTFASWFAIGKTQFNVQFAKAGTIIKGLCVQEKPGPNSFHIIIDDAGCMKTGGPTWIRIENP